MEKRDFNSIEHRTIKRHPSSGFLEIYELKNKNKPDKTLILLAEIEVSDKDNEKIIINLKNVLENEFFNSPAKNDEFAFESALDKANGEIKEILLSKPKNWLSKINITSIAVCLNDLYIASVGNAHAFLVHNQKIVDVIKPKQTISSPNPVKLFTNIIIGRLSTGNAIIVVNESVLDYLSEDRIRKCGNENDAKCAVEKISELLLRAPENKQFGILTIKREQQKEYSRITDEKLENAKNEKLETLSDIYQEKTNLDSEVFIRNKKTKISVIMAKIKPYAQEVIGFILSCVLATLEWTQSIFKKIPPLAMKLWILTRVVWKNNQARSYHFYKIKKYLSETARNATNIKLGKRGLAGFGIFLIALSLIISLTIKTKINQKHAQEAEIQNKIEQINQKINEAEAALIYDNKAGALALLSDAERIIQNISEPDSENIGELEKISSKIQDLKNKSENKKIISNLEPYITISPSPLSYNEAGIANMGSKILFFDGLGEKISIIDEEKGLLPAIPIQNIESFSYLLGYSEQTAVAFKKDYLIIIDTKKETLTKQSFAFDPYDGKKYSSYLNNLYTFDADKNQIIKYSGSGTAFSTGQNWLTQDYELATVKDISVDGYVYLIDSQGSIHVFLRGKFSKRIPWPANTPPGGLIKFWTSDSCENFYVLDSENKRIVIISKSGKLSGQIEAEEFKNATSMAVGAREKYIYVMSREKIYKIQTEI